jgi:hypothetical protein
MLMAQAIHSSFKPSLLTKTEIDWLSGKAQLSKTYEYKIKSKLKALSEFELPLILNSGLFPEEAANLAIFKNHDEATTSKTSLDCSNSTIKEDEVLGGVWRRRIEQRRPCRLGKAKVPGPNPRQDLSSYLNFNMEINYYSKSLSI